MTGNREVITGGDFKRMISGAYSEFLLEYEHIDGSKDDAGNTGHTPGTHILRTMGAAILPLADTKDESIGGLSRRVASAAMLGARGNAGVVLAQMFRGIAKGLQGKYDATSSEFGKAFQYGILYAQRVLPAATERPLITAAKAVAKGAYHAVRANLPISEILTVAIEAGEKSLDARKKAETGAQIMLVFLHGCLKGLDGNFVSPGMNLSLGLSRRDSDMLDPRDDRVRPYCVTFLLEKTKLHVASAESYLKDICRFVVVERHNAASLSIHVHTDHPGVVLESVIGWGHLAHVEIRDMAEPHALSHVHAALMPVAVLAVAEDDEAAAMLQENGAAILVKGSAADCPSVGELINAAHSDMAASYVMLANDESMYLVMNQAKYILGDRLELVIAGKPDSQRRAMQVFDAKASAKENAAKMRAAVEASD